MSDIYYCMDQSASPDIINTHLWWLVFLSAYIMLCLLSRKSTKHIYMMNH